MALLLCVFARPADAQQLKTLSGTWSASAMRSAWNVGDWGEACGPKPGGGAAPAGTVTIKQSGGELAISGAGRSYSTAECWEQMPGLARSSHSGGQRGWRTVCKSSAGDARQATVVTTVSASDSYITFDETGQYQFVIQGTNCTASVRRSRSFRLIQREGEAPPVAASSPPVASAAPAPSAKVPQTRCENPGPAARLEVRPSRKLMRAGEEFSFRALGLRRRGLRAAHSSRLADREERIRRAAARARQDPRRRRRPGNGNRDDRDRGRPVGRGRGRSRFQGALRRIAQEPRLHPGGRIDGGRGDRDRFRHGRNSLRNGPRGRFVASRYVRCRTGSRRRSCSASWGSCSRCAAGAGATIDLKTSHLHPRSRRLRRSPPSRRARSRT